MSKKKHSPAFSIAVKEYNAGRWNKAMLKILVERKPQRLTEDEYQEITGEPSSAYRLGGQMELQLIEFLIDTVEALLHIVRQQNSQLSQLGAVAAEEQLQDIEAAYSAVLKNDSGKEVDKANVD